MVYGFPRAVKLPHQHTSIDIFMVSVLPHKIFIMTSAQEIDPLIINMHHNNLSVGFIL